MNNIYKLIFFLAVFSFGCSPNLKDDNKLIQKIDTLNMNIFSKGGEKIYSITSPYSSFDSNKLEFKLKNTTINIFSGKEVKYIINADESTLSDNNKFLKLTGNVKFKTLMQDEDVLFADVFKWNVDDNNYLLEGNIKFENNKIILNSGKAKLGEDNIIEFSNPVEYIIKDDNNENIYEIKSENAYYNLDTESLNFKAKDKRVQSIIYF